jgi:pyroglutamyl-peptidase
MSAIALVTGFEPYGGRGINPSAKLAHALDGTRVAGVSVVGRTWPVTLAGLAGRIAAALDEIRPDLVIALGLWPGEAMIRLERFGVNLADFEIADNAGAKPRDAMLEDGGGLALAATLPLREIEHRLLAEGIPARLSGTAGAYLCNATLYSLLRATEARGSRILCGFIHLPYLPQQVAEMLAEARAGRLELHQRADVASMDFTVMQRAVTLALDVSAASMARAAR